MHFMITLFSDRVWTITTPDKEVFVSLLIIKNLFFVLYSNPHTLILLEVPAVYFGRTILGVESPAKTAIMLP